MRGDARERVRIARSSPELRGVLRVVSAAVEDFSSSSHAAHDSFQQVQRDQTVRQTTPTHRLVRQRSHVFASRN